MWGQPPFDNLRAGSRRSAGRSPDLGLGLGKPSGARFLPFILGANFLCARGRERSIIHLRELAGDRMRSAFHKPRYFFVLLLWIAAVVPAPSQQTSFKLEVPDKFTLDFQPAARLRPQLLSQSAPLPGRYAIGRLVFQKLTNELHLPAD